MTAGWLPLLVAVLSAQGQPAFRSGVELIRLDVSVVDEAGQPVRDLGSQDFIVRVDGKPRVVSFARFYGESAGQLAASPTEATSAPASFATNSEPVRGRVVVIVVDVESLAAGSEKLVLDTAGALVDRLGPADSVGLLLLPGKGIDLTRDHRRVREALERVRGVSPIPPDHAMTVREAEGFVRNDPRTMGEVIERECRPGESDCPMALKNQARQLLGEANRRFRGLARTLSDLNANLVGIDAPRTIILLSGGVPYREDDSHLLRDVRRAAAEAGTTSYVVQVEQPQMDVSSRARSGGLERNDLAEGLSSIAGATGATLRWGVGRALGAFERMRAEIVHTYQLGVASVAADADGKMHTIDVQVRRPGVTARARTEFVIPSTPRPALTAAGVLRLPPGLSEVPLTVSAYSTRGEEPSTLKVLVTLESAIVSNSAKPPSYAFTITSVDDRPVGHAYGTMKLNGDDARIVVPAQMPPGRYTLRGAVVDANGHAGSVELPLAVGLGAAGPFEFSDLIVGTSASGFWPAAEFRSGRASALLELYSADARHFDGIAVDLELREAAADAIVARAPAAVARTPLEGRRIAEGSIDLAGLAPGKYVVSAVVKRGGQTLARISRTIARRQVDRSSARLALQ